jgi:coproporphyrinogen III oxidase
MGEPDFGAVRASWMALQDRLCAALEAADGSARFREERLEGAGGTLARPRVLEDGAAIEKAAVHFTHSAGPALPPAATERHPELASAPFEAVALSAIVHPRNPYAPTSHCNVRFFRTRLDPDARRASDAGGAAGSERNSSEVAWWFGGGFDLTPCYGFEADAVAWHRAARAACARLGPDAWPRFKKWCDEYFFLPHRGEARGIGGIFFDDLAAPDFETCFAFARAVGDGYVDAYLPILRRRKDAPYGEREREFQLWRRGRYAEFNLAIDRGTRYGLQSGRRVESVLASLPPLVRWRYDFRPEPGSVEARLVDDFLKPRDWLAGRD